MRYRRKGPLKTEGNVLIMVEGKIIRLLEATRTILMSLKFISASSLSGLLSSLFKPDHRWSDPCIHQRSLSMHRRSGEQMVGKGHPCEILSPFCVGEVKYGEME